MDDLITDEIVERFAEAYNGKWALELIAAKRALSVVVPMIEAAAYERGQAEMRETAADKVRELWATTNVELEAAIRAIPTGGENGA